MDIKELIRKKKESLVIKDQETSSYEDYMASQIEKSNREQLAQLESKIESKRRDIEKFKGQINSISINLSESNKDLSNLLERLGTYNTKSRNGFYFFVSERRRVDVPKNVLDFFDEIKDKSKYGQVMDSFLSFLQMGEIDILFGTKKDNSVVPVMIKELGDDLLNLIKERILLKSENKDNIIVSNDKLTYVGDIISWNQIVDILNSLGFDQDPDFDILGGSNSYGV